MDGCGERMVMGWYGDEWWCLVQKKQHQLTKVKKRGSIGGRFASPNTSIEFQVSSARQDLEWFRRLQNIRRIWYDLMIWYCDSMWFKGCFQGQQMPCRQWLTRSRFRFGSWVLHLDPTGDPGILQVLLGRRRCDAEILQRWDQTPVRPNCPNVAIRIGCTYSYT